MSAPDPFENQKELAASLRALGVSAGYASDLAQGKRQPSLTLAVKIEEQLSIPVAAWLGRKPQVPAQDAAA